MLERQAGLQQTINFSTSFPIFKKKKKEKKKAYFIRMVRRVIRIFKMQQREISAQGHLCPHNT